MIFISCLTIFDVIYCSGYYIMTDLSHCPYINKRERLMTLMNED